MIKGCTKNLEFWKRATILNHGFMKCTFKTWEFYYFVLTIDSNYFGKDVKEEHEHHKLEGDSKRTQIKKRQMFYVLVMGRLYLHLLQTFAICEWHTYNVCKSLISQTFCKHFSTLIVRLNYARFIWIDISSICSKFSSYLLKN